MINAKLKATGIYLIVSSLEKGCSTSSPNEGAPPIIVNTGCVFSEMSVHVSQIFRRCRKSLRHLSMFVCSIGLTDPGGTAMPGRN